MQLKTFRVDGAAFVVSPYHPGIHIREDVFQRQFFVTCEGQIELPQDDPVYGTYWLDSTRTLGECGLIEEAIALAETCVEQHNFDLSDEYEEHVLSFSPELIRVIDDRGRRVLAGEIWGSGIRWCPPVSSSAEADEVSSQAAKLNSEASFERGWDNYCTAKGLELKARILRGRLVHRIWRDHAKAALTAAGI